MVTKSWHIVYFVKNILEVIFQQRERVFHRDIQIRENKVSRLRARCASVFVPCFRVFGYPGKTLARVLNGFSNEINIMVKCALCLSFVVY